MVQCYLKEGLDYLYYKFYGNQEKRKKQKEEKGIVGEKKREGGEQEEEKDKIQKVREKILNVQLYPIKQINSRRQIKNKEKGQQVGNSNQYETY